MAWWTNWIINEKPYEKGAFEPDDLVPDDFDDPENFIPYEDEDDDIIEESEDDDELY